MSHKFKPNQEPQKTEPNQHQSAMYRWMSHCDTLLTCLCMGKDHYVKERFRTPIDRSKPLEQRQVNIGGRVVHIKVPQHFPSPHPPETIAAIQARAESCLAHLEQDTGIPRTSWYALQERVREDQKLMAWLVAMKILPERPVDQTPRPVVPGDERMRRAEENAKAWVGA